MVGSADGGGGEEGEARREERCKEIGKGVGRSAERRRRKAEEEEEKQRKRRNSRARFPARSWCRLRRRRRRRRPVAMPNYITIPLPFHSIGPSVRPSVLARHTVWYPYYSLCPVRHTVPCPVCVVLAYQVEAECESARWGVGLGTRRGVLQGGVSWCDVPQRMPNGRHRWLSRRRRLYRCDPRQCLAHAAWRL